MEMSGDQSEPNRLSTNDNDDVQADHVSSSSIDRSIKTDNIDLKVTMLPKSVSFYETKAIATVNELLTTALAIYDNPKMFDGVLLQQEEPAGDVSLSFLEELESELLLDQLAGRLAKWRWLLSLIRNSPIPWLFSTRSECCGSFWELALSCQYRMWFKSDSPVGFPDIEVRAFPPGGIIESLNKRAGRTMDKWHMTPTSLSRKACEDGLIDFVSDATLWQETATGLARQLLQVAPKVGVRAERRSKARTDAGEDHHSLELSAKVATEQLEKLGQKDSNTFRGYSPSAWQFCWQLVNRRNKLNDQRDLGSIISYIAARHYLSPPYQAWLRGRLVRQRLAAQQSFTWSRAIPINIVIGVVAPPIIVIDRLLEAEANIIFSCEEASLLANGLNMIYGWLERYLDSAQARRLWNRHVTWYVGAPIRDEAVVCQCLSNESVTFRLGDRKIEGVRLAGNRSKAPSGVLEYRLPLNEKPTRLHQLCLGVANLISDGLVKSNTIGSSNWTVTYFTRLSVLGELIELCQTTGRDLEGMTESLRNVGWGFIGQNQSWERFFGPTHLSALADELHPLRIFRSRPNLQNELTSWSSAKTLAMKTRPDRLIRKTPWNNTSLSHHLATMVAALTAYIWKAGYVETLASADVLVGQSVGLPVPFGTPMTFAGKRGYRRIERYIEMQWPTFDRSILNELGSNSPKSIED